MAENSGDNLYIELAADIVSAYVSNNSVAERRNPKSHQSNLLRLETRIGRPSGRGGGAAQTRRA